MSGKKKGWPPSRLPPGQRHECLFCPRTFREYRDLEGHMNTHTNEQPYACPECDLHFNSRYKLYGHRQEVHMGKRWNCEICGVGFGKLALLCKHKHQVHKEWEENRNLSTGDNFFAIVNQIVVEKKDVVQVNGQMEQLEEKEQAEEEQEDAPEKDEDDGNGNVEENESEIIQEVKPFIEATAPRDPLASLKAEESETEQTDNEAVSSDQEEEDSHDVDMVRAESPPRKKLKKRKRKKFYFSTENGSSKRWKCDICGKVFVGGTDYSLRRHKRTVHCDVVLGIPKKQKIKDTKVKREWDCDLCGKRFLGETNYNLVRHKKAVHSDSVSSPKNSTSPRTPGTSREKREWTCDICGKIFIRCDSYSLKRHKMTVHSEITLGIPRKTEPRNPKMLRDWVCDICGKAFRQQRDDYSLRRHKRQVHKILEQTKSKIPLPLPEPQHPPSPTDLGSSPAKVEPDELAETESTESFTATYKKAAKSRKPVKSVTSRKDKVGASLKVIFTKKKKGWADPKKWKKWKCHLCGCIFHGRDRASLNRHLKSVHNQDDKSLVPSTGPTRRQWKCNVCGKTFLCKDRHTLFRHLRNVHQKNPYAFQDHLPPEEVEEKSLDETSVDETSVDETFVDETSVDETSVDETSVEEISVEEISGEETPKNTPTKKKVPEKKISPLKTRCTEKKKWTCDICGKIFTCRSRYNLKRHLESVHGVVDHVQTNNFSESKMDDEDVESMDEELDYSWSTPTPQETDSEEEDTSTTPFPPNISTSEPPSFEQFPNLGLLPSRKNSGIPTAEKGLPKKEWDAGFFLHMNRYKPEDSCFATTADPKVVDVVTIPGDGKDSSEEEEEGVEVVVPVIEGNKETAFQCKKCGKYLSGHYSLRRHENLKDCLKLKQIMEDRRSNQAYYRCTFCGKDFGLQRKNHLVRHISAIHRYQEPDELTNYGGRRRFSYYSCAFCPDMKSEVRDNVQNHIVTCHGDKLGVPIVPKNTIDENMEKNKQVGGRQTRRMEEVDPVAATQERGEGSNGPLVPQLPAACQTRNFENGGKMNMKQNQSKVGLEGESSQDDEREMLGVDAEQRTTGLQNGNHEMVDGSDEETDKNKCVEPTIELEGMAPFGEEIAGPSSFYQHDDDDDDTLTESSEFSSVGTEVEIIEDSQSAASPMNSDGEKPLSPAVLSMSPRPASSLEGFAHLPVVSSHGSSGDIRSLSNFVPEKEPMHPCTSSAVVPPPLRAPPPSLATQSPAYPSTSKRHDPTMDYLYRNSYNYCIPPPVVPPTTSATATTGYLNKTDFPITYPSHHYNHNRPPPPYHPPPPYISPPPPPAPPPLPPSPPTSTAFVILNDDDDVELFKQICDLTNPGVHTAVLVTSSKYPTSSSSASSGGSNNGSEGQHNYMSVSSSCSSDESSSSSLIEPLSSKSPPVGSLSLTAFQPHSPSPPPRPTFPNMPSLSDEELLVPVNYQQGIPSSSAGLFNVSRSSGISVAGTASSYDSASSGECSPVSVHSEVPLSSPSETTVQVSSATGTCTSVSQPESSFGPVSTSPKAKDVSVKEIPSEDDKKPFCKDNIEELSETCKAQPNDVSITELEKATAFEDPKVVEITTVEKPNSPVLSVMKSSPLEDPPVSPQVSPSSSSSVSSASSPPRDILRGDLSKDDEMEPLAKRECSTPTSDAHLSSLSASSPERKSSVVEERPGVSKSGTKRLSAGSSGGASLPSSPTQLVSSVEVACLQTLALLDSLPTTSAEIDLDFEEEEWPVAQSPPPSPVVIMTTGEEMEESEDDVNGVGRESPTSSHSEEYSPIVDLAGEDEEQNGEKFSADLEVTSNKVTKSWNVEKKLLLSPLRASSPVLAPTNSIDKTVAKDNPSNEDKVAQSSSTPEPLCTIPPLTDPLVITSEDDASEEEMTPKTPASIPSSPDGSDQEKLSPSVETHLKSEPGDQTSESRKPSIIFRTTEKTIDVNISDSVTTIPSATPIDPEAIPMVDTQETQKIEGDTDDSILSSVTEPDSQATEPPSTEVFLRPSSPTAVVSSEKSEILQESEGETSEILTEPISPTVQEENNVFTDTQEMENVKVETSGSSTPVQSGLLEASPRNNVEEDNPSYNIESPASPLSKQRSKSPLSRPSTPPRMDSPFEDTMEQSENVSKPLSSILSLSPSSAVDFTKEKTENLELSSSSPSSPVPFIAEVVTVLETVEEEVIDNDGDTTATVSPSEDTKLILKEHEISNSCASPPPSPSIVCPPSPTLRVTVPVEINEEESRCSPLKQNITMDVDPLSKPSSNVLPESEESLITELKVEDAAETSSPHLVTLINDPAMEDKAIVIETEAILLPSLASRSPHITTVPSPYPPSTQSIDPCSSAPDDITWECCKCGKVLANQWSLEMHRQLPENRCVVIQEREDLAAGSFLYQCYFCPRNPIKTKSCVAAHIVKAHQFQFFAEEEGDQHLREGEMQPRIKKKPNNNGKYYSCAFCGRQSQRKLTIQRHVLDEHLEMITLPREMITKKKQENEEEDTTVGSSSDTTTESTPTVSTTTSTVVPLMRRLPPLIPISTMKSEELATSVLPTGQEEREESMVIAATSSSIAPTEKGDPLSKSEPHSTSNDYVCIGCGRNFKDRLLMERHMNNCHTQEQGQFIPLAKTMWHSCSFCSKDFGHQRSHLIRHIVSWHSRVESANPELIGNDCRGTYNRQQSSFACPFCGVETSLKETMHRHIYSNHCALLGRSLVEVQVEEDVTEEIMVLPDDNLEGMEDSGQCPEDFLEVQMEEDEESGREREEVLEEETVVVNCSEEEKPPCLEVEMMHNELGEWVPVQIIKEETEEEEEMPVLEPSVIMEFEEDKSWFMANAEVQASVLPATTLISKVCEKCNRTFASFNNLKRHHRDVPHCALLQEKSPSKRLSVHKVSSLNRSSDSKTCEKCGRTFSRPQNLIRHHKEVPHCVLLKKVITKKALNACDKCGKSFVNQSSLNRHHREVPHCIWLKKGSDKAKTSQTLLSASAVTCNKCHRTFATRHTLKRHHRQVRHCRQLKAKQDRVKVPLAPAQKEPGSTQCHKCYRTFASPQNLRRHHREVPHCLLLKTKPAKVQSPPTPPPPPSPPTSTPTTCHKCGRTFVTSRNLMRHHKEVPDCVSHYTKDLVKSYHYSCPFCKHDFAHRRQHLLRHLATKHRCQENETDGEQYICGFCKDCCTSLLELERHILQAHLKLLGVKRT